MRRYGAAETFEGGLRVDTTLDLRLQRDAQSALKATLPVGPAGALVSIDPANGFIRAMTTTPESPAARVRSGLPGPPPAGLGDEALRPGGRHRGGRRPGHHLLRLKATGHPPARAASSGRSRPSRTPTRAASTWCRPPGSPTTRSTPSSPWTWGPPTSCAWPTPMGIISPLKPYPSIVLGSEAVSPLEVADAYATFADLGVRHAPQAIARVVFPDGKVSRASVHGVRAMAAGVAYVVDQVLEGNTRYGTAAAMPSYYAGLAAGKTGTTENSADAWFCGFDPLLATAVWMGYPQAEIAMPGVQGATYCVPIWGRYYEMVFGARAVSDFARPTLPVYRPWRGHHALGGPAAPGASPSSGATTGASPAPSGPATGAPTATGRRPPRQAPRPPRAPPAPRRGRPARATISAWPGAISARRRLVAAAAPAGRRACAPAARRCRRARPRSATRLARFKANTNSPASSVPAAATASSKRATTSASRPVRVAAAQDGQGRRTRRRRGGRRRRSRETQAAARRPPPARGRRRRRGRAFR